MKKLIVLLLMISGIISCNQKTQIEEEKAGVEIAIDEEIDSVKTLVRTSFEEIWSNLDSTKIEKYHTADFLLLENGIVWNNDSVRNYLTKERKEMEQQQYKRLNRLEFLKSVHNQNTIWIAYDNYGTWVKGTDTLGTVHWLESAIAIKDGNNWKLQQLHSTRIRK